MYIFCSFPFWDMSPLKPETNYHETSSRSYIHLDTRPKRVAGLRGVSVGASDGDLLPYIRRIRILGIDAGALFGL